MSVAAFTSGDGVIVTVRGSGKMHLLSYASNSSLPNHVGAIPTKSGAVLTRFILSHSYTFTKFAFYWEGAGEAVCGIGQGLSRIPVGTSWSSATLISYGGKSFTTSDVSSNVTSAVQRDGEVTCFIIPDNLL